jgi:EmrB/QacA subfamily drug resistance transporter
LPTVELFGTMTIEQLTTEGRTPMNRAERLTIAVTGAALFMVVLDNLIVASTLPAIQRSLGASLGSLEWVLNAYILAFAVLMLTAAALGERYGRRRVFTAGVLLFTVSSAAGALAPNAGTLIAARAVEGIGGAVIMPLTLTMMTAAFPADRRGAALGIWSAISGFGVALGPVAGGLLTDALSWHWIFWVNVPIGVAVAIAGPRVLAEGRGARERLDLTGVLLVSGGLLGVVFATVRGPSLGWGSASTLAAYAAGTALLAGFLWWERRSAHPMMPLRLFRSSAFSSANAANFLLAFAMFAGFLMLIQFLARARGEGPLSVGLHTLWWTAMPMFVAPYAGRLGRRVAPAAIAAGGLLVVASGMFALALLASPDAALGELAPAMVAIGVGIGLVIPNIAAAALAAVPPADIGKASGILSTSRQVGSVAGVSVGLAIYQATAGAGAAGVSDGVSAALLVAAVAAAAGAAAAGLRWTWPYRAEMAPA